MAYVNVRVKRRLKEELAWAIDKQLRLIINKMLFKTIIPLRMVSHKVALTWTGGWSIYCFVVRTFCLF